VAVRYNGAGAAMESGERHYMPVGYAGARGTILKIKQTTVKFGFTKNLGNFESMRVDVEFSADLGDSDDARQVVADLENLAKAEVRRIITGKVEKADELEDFY
jgi:hypothetical protein